MKRTRSRLKSLIIYTAAALQLTALSLPLTNHAFAQDSSQPAASVDTVYGTPPEGTPRPNGVAGHTYRYNLTTGMWENDYFIWNPNNNQTIAKYPEEHKFNASSNLWEVWQWRYVASSGKYEYRITATYAPPAADPEPAQTQAPNPGTTGISNTGSNSSNTITDSPDGTITGTGTGPNSNNSINNANNGNIAQTGPDSENTINVNNEGQVSYSGSLDVDVVNNVDSSAITGNANVLQNTSAGNATTGDALAMANIMNMLQSTWGSSSQAPEIYVADIQGDYVGDIVLDPSTLGMANSGCGCDLEVNISNDSSIENNVNLLAQSGNANVSMNTSAGNATTGDATAVANIINMINSSITSGKSFLGVLNIHGDFEGDVLVAEDIIDQLLAANVPTTQLSLCDCGDINAEFTDNHSITNNINTVAQTGQANVSHNTKAGNATSGNAETSITVFNLTGRTVVGNNAFLVFVNVLGEWVGFLTNAPGATAAMYGNGITENNACNDCGDININASNNSTINNNVNITAVTGDANVTYNTSAGDATTGDAKASANVSNITGSNFALSGWFGMLFINILGDWHGSFGTDTEYGGIAGTNIPNPVTGVAGNNVPSPQQRNQAPIDSTNGRVAPVSGVRVFSAAFKEDESGTPVVASISEATPPSPDSEAPGYIAPPADSSLLSLGLLIGISGISYLIFRRKSSSHTSTI